ncbi:DUF262 domain-containing protein [Acidovorax sp. Root402]|uniref:DUF262 domain-containing protein n=1 Tax=Acidovorax sp. Root402 TaxID=1736527 RepID=UPI0009E90E49|nr:DUF262 domain-containing protein [Acidovorax sp. Root402]
MRTSPTSLKVRQLITLTRETKLVPRPEFQRRLVWTTEDKIRFMDTILKGMPFPEIYVANGPVDVNTGEGQQLLVDGQQRVTTIVDYFTGDPKTYGTVLPSYASLDADRKRDFLDYDVTVRDLGTITSEQIVDIFRRINSTRYSLNEIEINNAVYTGALMTLASGFAEHEFFDKHRVFRPTDIKRMGDVRFVLQLIVTLLGGYFDRDELLEQYLSEFNEGFPLSNDIARRLTKVFDFIDECGFTKSSRIWKRSDLFSAIVSLDRVLSDNPHLSPSDGLSRLEAFYTAVDNEGMTSQNAPVGIYAKAAIQASNDRINRLRRGLIIEAVLADADPLEAMRNEGLV